MPQGCVALIWLGQAGFLIEGAGQRIIIDPYLSNSLAEKYFGKKFPHIRMTPAPFVPAELTDIDWLLCTHAHTDHMDPGTIPDLVATNPDMRVLVPRATRTTALERGVPPDRLFMIDAGESMDMGDVAVTATPAAHETLSLTTDGLHPFLGFVLTIGRLTIWHSGDTIPFDGLVPAVRNLGVDLALLPINGRDALRASNGIPGNLTVEEAVHLTNAIGASHMLGHHFNLFEFNTVDPSDARMRISNIDTDVDVSIAERGQLFTLRK
ncbi:MBL fold metallo-hydrolase [Gymnodinialimonas hymeniacidonis]|uniref:MBL fold metallo-hydrolase n=1 Tax=Gymnodinialimonas hymeniacidonis TaxID=3126508 RepID=UPI0034C6858A